MDEVVAFAKELIQTPSPSKNEGALAKRVVAEMQRLGYDEAYIDEAGNAIGVIYGKEEGPGWLLLTHLDHVDPGDLDRWPHGPFSGHLDESGRLWGRGAVDIKGPLAATVHCSKWLKDRPPRTLYVASVVEEELGGRGAHHLVQTLGERFGAAVVAEPSKLKVMHGHRGVARVKVEFLGRAHHAALGRAEDNPNFALAKFLTRLASARVATHPLLGAAQITPTLLYADTESQNRTPGKVTLLLDWRTVGEGSDEMRSWLSELLRGLPARFAVPEPWAAGEVENTPGFVTEPDHPLVLALSRARRQVLGEAGAPGLWFFATDGRYTAAAGIPTAGLGPGDPELAHTEAEWVKADELIQAARIYAALVSAPWPLSED